MRQSNAEQVCFGRYVRRERSSRRCHGRTSCVYVVEQNDSTRTCESGRRMADKSTRDIFSAGFAVELGLRGGVPYAAETRGHDTYRRAGDGVSSYGCDLVVSASAFALCCQRYGYHGDRPGQRGEVGGERLSE